MDTLREKLEQVAGGSRIDAIMQIIENHIEWLPPCEYGHVFSTCGKYEITDGGTLYHGRVELGEYNTLDAAKQAAQKHKEGRG